MALHLWLYSKTSFKKLTILFFFTPEEALAMEESTMLIFQKSCKFPTVDMLPSEQKPRHMTQEQLV